MNRILRDWWVCTPHGRLPWWRLAGLSPAAVELYALVLELAAPSPGVVAHPSACEHATSIVEGWSQPRLGRQIGVSASTVCNALRELEHTGLVERLPGTGLRGSCNAYVVTRGVYGNRCPADLPQRPGPPDGASHSDDRP